MDEIVMVISSTEEHNMANVAMGKWWVDQGIDYLGFGDTTGSSNPLQVSHFYEYMVLKALTRIWWSYTSTTPAAGEWPTQWSR